MRLAGIGPVPMIAGSTPAWAQEAMRASEIIAYKGFTLKFRNGNRFVFNCFRFLNSRINNFSCFFGSRIGYIHFLP